MKKILSVTLIVFFIFSLCACQADKGGNDSSLQDAGSQKPTASNVATQNQVSTEILDEVLEKTADGTELLELAKAFSEIPVGYLNTVDKDYTSFKDKRDFKDVAPLDMAIFICNYLANSGQLWSKYQGTFGYEGYRVPAKDLNEYAKKLFGYEYDFSKIKETNGYGKEYKYIASSDAFDVRVYGTAFTNGECEYKGVFQKVSDDEYKVKFVIWENEEGQKPDGKEGTDWYLDDMENYWEYDDAYVLTVKKIDNRWKYISFLEIED